MWWHKDFKAQQEDHVETHHHGCKNLTHTSKTRHVKMHPDSCNCYVHESCVSYFFRLLRIERD